MAKRKQPWHHKEVLSGMYKGQGLTIRQIAQILETTASNILYWMRKFEIETRQFLIGDINRGIKLSKEQKKHLSDMAKERFEDKENHPMYGRKHSEISKRKMSETKKRRNRERRLRRIYDDSRVD